VDYEGEILFIKIKMLKLGGHQLIYKWHY